jgi:asparagine synthase (glutamine-hydrolysing)
MCGICGVITVGASTDPITPEVLERMTDSMIHRGPNDRGTFIANGVALGARRLSIVDIAGGHQPFGNEDGTIQAIQNGELYNHRDLRRLLAADGHVFRSKCDTEVLPHLYERYGEDFPKHLRGMFAIAIWDGRRQRAVVARDRLGIKPLYYAHVGPSLVFASELKSLLASELIAPELDLEAIDAYLSFGFVPAPRTPLAGVSKLLPGHVLVVDEDGVRTSAYWHYPKPQPDRSVSKEAWSDELLELLDESVRLRLMSDVPLGAMLSGGLDSSMIVALMARHMSEPVQTFAVGFRGRDNELADARYVSSFFGAEHREIELGMDDSIDLAQLVWHLDEPLADLSSLGFLALSGLASRHVTVALSGQGADELLGGYDKHRAASLAGRWRSLPALVRLAPERFGARAPGRLGRLVRTLAAAGPADRLLEASGPGGGQRRLAGSRLARFNGSTALAVATERLDGVPDDPLAAALFLDGQLGLPDDMLHYFDRASMAYSLEVRVPFLDHEFVELCARIPADLKVRRGTTKYLLKRAARGIVPDRIIDKRKIGFFNADAGEWFRGQASRAVDDYLLRPDLASRDLFDADELRRLLRAQQAGRTSKWENQLLLAALMLEVWLSTYLPRATAAGSRDVVGARTAL